jgi:hypothetical protein
MVDDIFHSRVLGVFDIQEKRHKGHHDDAAIHCNAAEYIILDISQMRRDAVGARMREDDGCAGDGEDVAHRVGRHVGDIDHHAQPVHFADQVAAKGGESLIGVHPRGLHRRPCGAECIVAVVGDRDVAGAHVEELAQCAEGVPRLMSAFDPDHAADFALLVGFPDAARVGAEFEEMAVFVDQPFGDVDLFESVADGPLGFDI